jgi:hypothetical protein
LDTLAEAGEAKMSSATGPPSPENATRRLSFNEPLNEIGRGVDLGQKLVGEDVDVSSSNVQGPGSEVKRLLAQRRRLKRLERFFLDNFWAHQAQRCRLEDELARLGVPPFDRPETGLQP